LLVRGESLDAGMSDYLIRQIEATSNVEVRLSIRVVEGRGEERLEALALEDARTGEREPTKAETANSGQLSLAATGHVAQGLGGALPGPVSS